MSKYAASHISPNGPGDARPTALQIIQDENLTGQLTGKAIFITGCSSGIGIETARALSTTGATLYLTARDLTKARAALGDVCNNKNVHLLHLDLNSFSSVREAAAEFLAKSSTLNILICNAGIMIPPEGRTADGFELQFGTNHLAHFLLIQLLKETLLQSALPSFPSRVVLVSSSAHRQSEVRFTDYNFEHTPYDPWKAYGQSKTAMIWAANELDRRFASAGLNAYSLHPGSIVSGLQKHVTEEMRAYFASIPGLKENWKSPEQGAATTVWAALARELEGRGGTFLENCRVIGPLGDGAGVLEPGFAPWVYDRGKAERLYDLSLRLVGLDGC
ncbi:hypothetical protein BJX99DRAFT_268335 [Aspergillus californicus]